ncbi:L-methionine (R)-S-oxide reductase [Malassezia nana]|uniref:L-methionine (R)-S-oxide reductase n=1 Tax=Malassezia nana TaxID=180528 RepID=A0AAF0ELA4_9BASI|nr:L-methionine (R)-S-oxide reductase [Malassezia nana]
MVHADAAAIPSDIQSKTQFYEYVALQLAGLLDGQRGWVTNLANVSAILYHSMNRFHAWKDLHINWAGFYILSPLFPGALTPTKQPTLLLGPFCGLPACQAIPSVPGRGVCADGSAQLPPKAVCVPHTDAYPGHIACDSLSQSEIVVPITVPRTSLSDAAQAALRGEGPEDLVRAWSGRGEGDEVIIGVLDIDCESQNGFDHEDVDALERLVWTVSQACDWCI